jgi:hypothetical protein
MVARMRQQMRAATSCGLGTYLAFPVAINVAGSGARWFLGRA